MAVPSIEKGPRFALKVLFNLQSQSVTRVIYFPQRCRRHVSVCHQSGIQSSRGLIGWTELELQFRCELIGLEAAPLCETIGGAATVIGLKEVLNWGESRLLHQIMSHLRNCVKLGSNEDGSSASVPLMSMKDELFFIKGRLTTSCWRKPAAHYWSLMSGQKLISAALEHAVLYLLI